MNSLWSYVDRETVFLIYERQAKNFRWNSLEMCFKTNNWAIHKHVNGLARQLMFKRNRKFVWWIDCLDLPLDGTGRQLCGKFSFPPQPEGSDVSGQKWKDFFPSSRNSLIVVFCCSFKPCSLEASFLKTTSFQATWTGTVE